MPKRIKGSAHPVKHAKRTESASARGANTAGTANVTGTAGARGVSAANTIPDVTLILPAVFTDHPSFPEAVLARTLEAGGFSAAIAARPHWQEPKAFAGLPKPRLFFAIVPGPVDSVVLNYTSTRKRRREDLYQYNGKAYFDDLPESISSKIRPDRVLTVFAARLRESFKDVPVIIGGLEGSQRRFTHWDFQQEKVRRSILLDTRADLLVIGMGEKQILAAAQAIASGEDARNLCLAGTARVTDRLPPGAVLLPAAEEVLANPALLLSQYQKEQEAIRTARPAAQACGNRFVVYEGPARYTSGDLDAAYGLPFTRSHGGGQGIVGRAPERGDLRAGSPGQHTMTPALRMNLFSVTTHRGCAGGCAFCSINAHEGRGVLSRSPESIMEEIRRMQTHPEWRGIVGDLGAASAEMYGADCARARRDTRAGQNDARADQSNTRADQSNTRADQNDVRADQNDARADQSDTRAGQSNTRAGQNDARADQSDTHDGRDAAGMAVCAKASCLAPEPCALYTEREGRAWMELLRAARAEPGVRKVMAASGVRYETLLRNPRLLEEILTHHTGRFLRVAPEHTEDHVLALMGKPPHAHFVRFVELFRKTAARAARSAGNTQSTRRARPAELACYIVVGHPGETAEDVSAMRTKLAGLGLLTHLDVQIFTPTPGTLSTAFYAAAADENGRSIAVERGVKELVRRQRLLIP